MKTKAIVSSKEDESYFNNSVRYAFQVRKNHWKDLESRMSHTLETNHEKFPLIEPLCKLDPPTQISRVGPGQRKISNAFSLSLWSLKSGCACFIVESAVHETFLDASRSFAHRSASWAWRLKAASQRSQTVHNEPHFTQGDWRKDCRFRTRVSYFTTSAAAYNFKLHWKHIGNISYSIYCIYVGMYLSTYL